MKDKKKKPKLTPSQALPGISFTEEEENYIQSRVDDYQKRKRQELIEAEINHRCNTV